MKIIITESQYKILEEQLTKLIRGLTKSTPKIIKNTSKLDNIFKISFKEFDDINNSLWRKLGDKGKHKEAANYMLEYLKINNSKLEDWQKGGILWHVGQMYAFMDDYKNAIKYMSMKDVLNSIEPNYLQGTLAFLNKDKKSLMKFYDNLKKNDPTGGSGRDILKNFIDNFDKSYKEIY